jgi:hypothetical protein
MNAVPAAMFVLLVARSSRLHPASRLMFDIHQGARELARDDG